RAHFNAAPISPTTCTRWDVGFSISPVPVVGWPLRWWHGRVGDFEPKGGCSPCSMHWPIGRQVSY
ncbi:hypothetical protein PIB30_103017, partial [Stylosanthes scabra]|nr:hypothetical protein [Stylosanthes scabra]